MISHSWIIQKVLSRLHNKNQNWICVICGPTGTGKSYTALRIAELIDPDFDIDRCTFHAEEFLNLVNSGVLKTGSAIILDEAGVGIPARQWYDICNKSVNYVLQTFRRENVALIMTTPSLSFIDVQARMLSHAYVDTQKIDRKKKMVLVKFMACQLNPKTGKVYYKYYRKGRQALKRVWIEKPSAGLIKDYERKKRIYSKGLYASAMKDIEKIELKKKLTSKEIAEEILKNPKPFLREWQGKTIVVVEKVMLKFGVGRSVAKKVKIVVEEALEKITQGE
jgi:hypothetical protein